jgi:hypothetical protein
VEVQALPIAEQRVVLARNQGRQEMLLVEHREVLVDPWQSAALAWVVLQVATLRAVVRRIQP